EAVERMAAAVADISVGDPADEQTVCGPLITSGARDDVLAKVEAAVGAGARLVCGGGHDGNVIEPVLLADVDPALDVSCSEIFGPVVVMTPFADEAEAALLANGTP